MNKYLIDDLEIGAILTISFGDKVNY